MQGLRIAVISAVFVTSGLLACDDKDPKPTADPNEKANEACHGDEKASADRKACEACCEDHGVPSYQYEGIAKECICG